MRRCYVADRQSANGRENISGKEAAKINLVNRAVPLDILMDETLAMAETIAANSPVSIAMIKKGLFMARSGVSMDALMDFEIEACLACVSTKARENALADFEKRK